MEKPHSTKQKSSFSKELTAIKEIIEDLDYEITSGMEQIRSKIGNYFWKFWTISGYPYAWIAIGLICGIAFDLYHVGYVIMFASLSTLAIVVPLKYIVSRRRPYDKHKDLRPLRREREHDWSFPSGHTYYVTVNGVSLALIYGGAISLFLMIGLGILVGCSRLYLGVHYFSDVVVAFFLALLVAYVIYLYFPLIMVLHYLT